MVLKLLKKLRKSSKGAPATKGAESNRYCDDSTASSSSGSLLESLAREGKWDVFLSLAENGSAEDWCAGNNQDDSVHSSESAPEPKMTSTPLHLALAHRPPVKIVDSLVTILKEKYNILVPEEFQDDQGRTPLHVAVCHSCDEEIAERLVTGDNLLMPAVLRDNQDRTPLHWACASPIVKPTKQPGRRKNTVELQKFNKRRVMCVLMKHYPEGAALTDTHGKTALEYARENKISDSSTKQLEVLERECDCLIHEHEEPSISSIVDFDSNSVLEDTNIPCVVPSPDKQGCWLQKSLSTLNLDEAPSAIADDISTIGDNEAEMYNVGSWECD